MQSPLVINTKLINLSREILQQFTTSLLENVKKNPNSTIEDPECLDALVSRLPSSNRVAPELQTGFKNIDFPIVHLLLRTALHEHLSTESPDPKEGGLLYLYDGQVQDYRSDHIEWESTKMNIKIIVYNSESNAYRLKNKREENGVAVMRRQTWTGTKNGIEWRKHEYKLFNRVTFYFHANSTNGSDGLSSLSSRDSLELLNFPVLVHYFRSEPASSNTRRKSSPSASRSATPLDTSALDESSTAATTSTRKRSRTRKRAASDVRILSPASVVPTVVVTNHILTTQHPTSSSSSPPPPFPTPPSQENGVPHQESFDVPLPSPPFISELTSEIPLISSPSQLSALEGVSSNLTQVISYSPDSGPADEPTKVIIVCRFPAHSNHLVAIFGETEVPVRQIDEHVFELFTPRCIPGVRQFFLAAKVSSTENSTNFPPSSPSQSSSAQNTVLSWNSMSTIMEFFFLPTYPAGHLCLSNLNLETNESVRVRLGKFRHVTRELDLAYNGLSNIEFLSNFHRLKTLIIDNNKISSATVFPHLPKLQTLFVNSNLISQLDLFLDHICSAFPNLKYLSLLDNEANPFQRFPHHYYNYRVYVISRLKRLTQLDSALVTDEERYHAASLAQTEDK